MMMMMMVMMVMLRRVRCFAFEVREADKVLSTALAHPLQKLLEGISDKQWHRQDVRDGKYFVVRRDGEVAQLRHSVAAVSAWGGGVSNA